MFWDRALDLPWDGPFWKKMVILMTKWVSFRAGVALGFKSYRALIWKGRPANHRVNEMQPPGKCFVQFMRTRVHLGDYPNRCAKDWFPTPPTHRLETWILLSLPQSSANVDDGEHVPHSFIWKRAPCALIDSFLYSCSEINSRRQIKYDWQWIAHCHDQHVASEIWTVFLSAL